jgi:hypothetical protein
MKEYGFDRIISGKKSYSDKRRAAAKKRNSGKGTANHHKNMDLVAKNNQLKDVKFINKS